jgi:hypothetical protein
MQRGSERTAGVTVSDTAALFERTLVETAQAPSALEGAGVSATAVVRVAKRVAM